MNKKVKKVLKSSEYRDILNAKERVLKAKEITEEMLAKAQETQQEAYAKGYEEGAKQAQLDNVEQTVKLVTESIDYLNQFEQDITTVVLSCVRKIIESYEPDELAIQSIKLSIKELANSKQILLRASPELAKTLFNRISEFDNEANPISLVADERLEKNNCTLESELGILHVNANGVIDKLQEQIELCLPVKPSLEDVS